MFPTILSILLTVLLGGDDSATNDAKTLIDTIEAIQQPMEDFRCEFEGARHFKGKVAENERGKIGEDGLSETFSGIFIWKRGGDTYSDSLNRMAVDSTITRESLVVRMRQHQAEQYHRLNDAPLGDSVIKSPKEAHSWRPNSLGYIFLIDKLKRDVADEWMEPSVEEDQSDGRPLKVLNIALKKVADSLIFRYWIDLRRSGHVVRMETYSRGRVMTSRLDVTLAPFKVGDTEVWMPISGYRVGYGAVEDKKPIVTKDPTVLEKISVVGGTMEFNKRPGPEVFTIKYKPGPPITDHLRKLTTEFGRQKIGLKPTKADAEKMLNEQIAKAQEQKAELVVAPPSQSFDWSLGLLWGTGTLVLLSIGILWLQQRRP